MAESGHTCLFDTSPPHLSRLALEAPENAIPHHLAALTLAAAALSATPLLAQRFLVAEDDGPTARFHLLDTRIGARFEFDAFQLIAPTPKLSDLAHVRGQLWVAQWSLVTGTTVDRFDLATGAALGTLPLGSLDGRVSIAVVADGVWLASHGQLQKRSFNGTVVTTLQVPHIVDVATDGNEVVALRASNSLGYSMVERFDVAGSPLGSVTLGISGMNADALELRASNGNFLLSGGVRLYECDRLTGAIVQVLEVGFFEQAALELVDGRLVSLNSGNATIVDVEGDPATASEVPGTAGRQFISIAPFDAGDPRARRFCPSGPNSSGAAAQIGVRGTTRTSDGTLWLDAFGGPAGAPGLFILGASGAPQVVGNGTFCLGGPILRTGTLGTFDGAGNRAHVALPYAIDLAAGPVVTGSTWTFQYLFRDAAAGGRGFDLTDAIEVTFD